MVWSLLKYEAIKGYDRIIIECDDPDRTFWVYFYLDEKSDREMVWMYASRSKLITTNGRLVVDVPEEAKYALMLVCVVGFDGADDWENF